MKLDMKSIDKHDSFLKEYMKWEGAQRLLSPGKCQVVIGMKDKFQADLVLHKMCVGHKTCSFCHPAYR